MINWIKNKIKQRSQSLNSILKYPQGRRIYSEFHKVRKAYIDNDALKVIGRLHQFGYKAYLVGGGVRDLVLGKQPKDFDIVTNAKPNEIRKIFANSRIIGRRFKLVHVVFHGNKIIEVATVRSLPKSRFLAKRKDDLYLTRDNEYGNFKEDAARRDFSINSLLFDIRNESIIDYIGGFEDLQNKIIRIIGDENISLPEDPVRILRAVKFSSMLDFALHPDLLKGIKKNKKLIKKASLSRLHEEFNKIFRTGQSYKIFSKMIEVELFQEMFPKLSEKAIENEITWPTNFENTNLGKRLLIADTMIAEHEDINTNVYYALFLTDAMKVHLNKKHTISYTQIRSACSLIEKELGLTKKEFDLMLKIFSSQNQFLASEKNRKNWAESFKNKNHFLESFIFYKLHARAEQDNFAIQKALFWEIGLRKKLPGAIRKHMNYPPGYKKSKPKYNNDKKRTNQRTNQKTNQKIKKKSNQKTNKNNKTR